MPHENPDNRATSRSFWDTINPGYIIAGISTLIASTWLNINKNYHKNQLENHAYDKIIEAKDEAYRIYRDPAIHVITPKASEFAVAVVESKKNHHADAIEKKFAELTGKVNELEGGNTFIGKWSRLKGHQKWQTALAVATVGSVAVGAIYSFTRERRLAEKLHQQVAKNERDQQSASL